MGVYISRKCCSYVIYCEVSFLYTINVVIVNINIYIYIYVCVGVCVCCVCVCENEATLYTLFSLMEVSNSYHCMWYNILTIIHCIDYISSLEKDGAKPVILTGDLNVAHRTEDIHNFYFRPGMYNIYSNIPFYDTYLYLFHIKHIYIYIYVYCLRGFALPHVLNRTIDKYKQR